MSYDVLLILVAMLGAAAGIMAWDIKDRRALMVRLEHEKDAAAEAAKKLSEIHNNLTHQLQQIGDKLASHDMVIRNNADARSSLMGGRKG